MEEVGYPLVFVRRGRVWYIKLQRGQCVCYIKLQCDILSYGGSQLKTFANHGLGDTQPNAQALVLASK